MKKIYLLITLLLTSLLQAQGSEDFTNSNATGTYAASSFVGNNGVTWTYGQSRDEGVYPISTKGLMLRRASDSFLEATITGGIGNLQFDYRKAFTGTTTRQLEVLINGIQVTTSPAFGTVNGEETTVYNLNHNVNQPGTVVLRIKNVGTSATNAQTTIDNIVWTAYSGTATPSITISSPTSGAMFSPETTNVNVALSVLNFNVANGTGDGHIHYTINGGAVNMKYDTTPIVVPTTPGVYTIYAELVDNAHAAISPAQNATVTFTVANYTNVADLATLRTQPLNGYYNLLSAPTTTYTRATRNQKYAQDATAAILIDDNAGVLNALSIVEDEEIAGLKGQLTSFSNVLQFVPTTAVGVTNTGVPAIIPATLLYSDITANPAGYRESELVNLGTTTFSNLIGTNFAVNTNYTVGQGTDTTVFRTLFSEADYIGTTVVPTTADIIALVTRNGATKQIVVRRLADMANLSRNDFDAIAGLRVYPNPANTVLNITSDSFATKNVEIYNVMGAKVLATQVTNAPVNVAGLTTGVYMVKVTEEGKTATRKLVIE